MNVGIVGLGLIGGSLARGYKVFSDAKTYAMDIDQSILDLAIMAKVVDDRLTPERLADCDVIFISIYPKATIDWLEEYGKYIAAHTLVIDCCGVKQSVCETGFRIAKQHGFTFVGGHPMAGLQYSGFAHSKESLFEGAAMIVVPENHNDIELLQKIKTILKPLRFGKFTITTPEKHDAMIAFTSQMPHLVSNAFIKSPTAFEHKGYSAGSMKDFTRVAYLNEDMWAELFLENRLSLIKELDILTKSLGEYKEALENNDFMALRAVLSEGKAYKIEVDAQCRLLP